MRWRELIYILLIVALLGISLTLAGQQAGSSGKSKRAALIDIQGTIASASTPLQTTTTPDKIRSLTHKALAQDVKGIIYRINSPGGTVVTSKDVFRIINSSQVPTVCLMKDYATSGAYWASLGCDKIIADPLTITGNIGAKSSYLEFSGLLNKLGIDYVNLTSGKFKGTGSPLRNITASEKELLLEQLETIEGDFLRAVEQRRGLSKAVIPELEEGKVFLGKKAKELELIDYLGGRKRAIEVIKGLTGLESIKISKIEQERGLTDLISRLFVKLGRGIGQSLSQTQASKIEAKYG